MDSKLTTNLDEKTFLHYSNEKDFWGGNKKSLKHPNYFHWFLVLLFYLYINNKCQPTTIVIWLSFK